MVVRNYRTELLLHCVECGVKSPFYTDPLKCPECGKGIKYHCRMCGHKFNPSDLCSICRWWICPECGTCGCHYYDKYKRVQREEEALRFIKIFIQKYPNIDIWLRSQYEQPIRPRRPQKLVTPSTKLHELM